MKLRVLWNLDVYYYAKRSSSLDRAEFSPCLHIFFSNTRIHPLFSPQEWVRKRLQIQNVLQGTRYQEI
jgi:hypothetical protein